MPHRPSPARLLPTLAMLITALGALAVLVAMRPRLEGSPSAWGGDDLAYACAWLIAAACTAWIALTTVAWLGQTARGHHGSAARIAGWAPPVARRILQATLVGTWALVPAAAYATPASPPFVLHVGPGGRIATISPSPGSDDAPVVRTPPPTTATKPATTTTAAPTPLLIPVPIPTTASPTAVAVAVPPVIRASHSHGPSAARPSAPTSSHATVVRAGDNLWRIAQREIGRRTGVERPDNDTVASYWQHVVVANRATLRSGDPSLVFPGEIVTLP